MEFAYVDAEVDELISKNSLLIPVCSVYVYFYLVVHLCALINSKKSFLSASQSFGLNFVIMRRRCGLCIALFRI